MRHVFISLVLSLVGFIAVAANTKAASTETLSENFRCEKLLSTSLADFKSTMIENCNLNKPFSSSLSRILNEDSFFYCCHKK